MGVSSTRVGDHRGSARTVQQSTLSSAALYPSLPLSPYPLQG